MGSRRVVKLPPGTDIRKFNDAMNERLDSLNGKTVIVNGTEMKGERFGDGILLKDPRWDAISHGCKEDEEWVDPYMKDNGEYVHGFCRKRK